ncbi:MAG: hypothetical protein ABH830_04885 [Patescibacteria group bacterium]
MTKIGICPKCRGQYKIISDDKEQFCKNCGRKLNLTISTCTTTCKSNKQAHDLHIDPEDNFCPVCGAETTRMEIIARLQQKAA